MKKFGDGQMMVDKDTTLVLYPMPVVNELYFKPAKLNAYGCLWQLG